MLYKNLILHVQYVSIATTVDFTNSPVKLLFTIVKQSSLVSDWHCEYIIKGEEGVVGCRPLPRPAT